MNTRSRVKRRSLFTTAFAALCLLLGYGPLGTATEKSSDYLRITGDSFNAERTRGIATYDGNARVSQRDGSIDINLAADKLIVKLSPAGKYVYFKAIGSPARYQQKIVDSTEFYVLEAKQIIFYYADHRLEATRESYFKQSSTGSGFVSIRGDTINIKNLEADEHVIQADGYPLAFESGSESRPPLSATARFLEYNSLNQQLKLEGQVKMQDDHGLLKAEQILYNGKTQVTQVPKIPNHQVEIIQLKGEQ